MEASDTQEAIYEAAWNLIDAVELRVRQSNAMSDMVWKKELLKRLLEKTYPRKEER